MEDMLPELDDLVKRELFTQVGAGEQQMRVFEMLSANILMQAEIRSMIKKRRDFEYSLKRRKLYR